MSDWNKMTHEYDNHYPGLATVLDGFEAMVGEDVDEMGYREAEAAYMAVMALDWFGNYGPGYQERLSVLQKRLAERTGNDYRENVVRLD